MGKHADMTDASGHKGPWRVVEAGGGLVERQSQLLVGAEPVRARRDGEG